MPCLRRLFRLLPIGLVLAASTAFADARASDSERSAIGRGSVRAVSIGDGAKQMALSRSSSWQRFNSSHGSWKALWNEQTGTPHRAYGRPIALRGFSDNPASVATSVKGFVASNPEVFGGSPTIETRFIERRRNLWYVRYRQTVSGVPVLFSDWEFRVGANGKLMAFGADARPTTAGVETTPALSAAAAREAAKAGLGFDAASDRVDEDATLYLLPWNSGSEYRLVYDVRVHTRKPRGNWINLVDAHSGEVLWRKNRVRYADIVGTVSTRIHARLPSDPLAGVETPDLQVFIGATPDITDPVGYYSALCSGTTPVSADLAGPYCKVVRLDGEADAHFSANTGCPGTRNINWDQSNSSDAERDAFYHTVMVHNYLKQLDPTYTGSDYQMQIGVNSLDDECLAYWDGLSITLGIDGTTCANMASVPDIVYHEYMHRANDDIFFSRGSSFGMLNGTLQEGTSDLAACFMQDEATFGNGIYGAGTYLRNLADVRRWPENRSTDPNETGLILSGTFWDLRLALGLPIAGQLAHDAKYGLPDDEDDGVAMSEYFIETLVADDDDEDISNGTPHMNELITAFNAHNIGTNYFIQIGHATLTDQPTGGPYPVTATIQYSGPIGGLNATSPTLYLSANAHPGQGYRAYPMSPTGNPDEWGAEIPGQSAAIVRYYIEAADLTGATKTLPPGGASNPVLFIAGPASTLILHDMESSPGWVVGAAGDNATSGFWQRVDPISTVAQMEDDHTDAGTLCWVTGNAEYPQDPPGINDVDDGKTTLVTNAFDAVSGGLTFPIIRYFRWFSNNAGESPNTDPWQVDISNNGGASWVNVESTLLTDQSWRRVIFYVKDYVTPTSNMKMRFIATDNGLGSLIEAGVDDFEVIAFSGPVDVPAPAPLASLALAPATPNPFSLATRLGYTLPVAGRVEVSVYDLNGREIRELVATSQEAGPHSVEWDGRDRTGRPVASGPYFVRLFQNGQRSSQAVVRVR